MPPPPVRVLVAATTGGARRGSRTVRRLSDLYTIEIEPEVRLWLSGLPDHLHRRVEEKAEMLATHPTTLGEPNSRHLGNGVRELRFNLDREAIRVTFWLASGRRIVLLTVFRKTRMREEAEVKRALAAQERCATQHGRAHDVYTRDAIKETP